MPRLIVYISCLCLQEASPVSTFGAAQPCLIVNDLKRGEGHGQIALWAHASTDAYFANFVVRQKPNGKI